MAEKDVKLDVIQPNKALEIKFKAMLTTYFLTLRKSVLLLFLLYLINLRKDNSEFLKAQKSTNKREFKLKNKSIAQNNSDNSFDEQIKQYIVVIMLLVSLLGDDRNLLATLRTFTQNILFGLQQALAEDLRQPIYSYVRSQAWHITNSMTENCVRHGMSRTYVTQRLYSNVPPTHPADELGTAEIPPLPHGIEPVTAENVTAYINDVGQSVQTDITGMSTGSTGVITGGSGGGGMIPPTPPTVRRDDERRGRWLSENSERRLRRICIDATIHAARLTYRLISDIVPYVVDWIYHGGDQVAIWDAILDNDNIPRQRAESVLLQITMMTNQAIQRQNMLDLGFEKATWIHVPGEFTSRQTHIKFNGREFDLTEGLFDTDVERNVFPAELWYCRCIMRGIIPAELTTGEREENEY